MKPYKVIISGGGTGGHLYPALAIADEFQSRYNTAEILFVGALGRIEMDKVPKSGYRITGLWIDGIQRSLSIRNLMFPVKLVFELAQIHFHSFEIQTRCSSWYWWLRAVLCFLLPEY